jgi:hypothetical protein
MYKGDNVFMHLVTRFTMNYAGSEGPPRRTAGTGKLSVLNGTYSFHGKWEDIKKGLQI